MALEDRKEPPHDIEAEKVVLGAAMSNPDHLALVHDTLSEEDFYLARHRAIYAVIRNLFRNNSPVDVFVVRSRLAEREELNDSGGLDYLVELDDYRDFAANLDAHIAIVRDKAVLRRLIGACVELKAMAYTQHLSAKETLNEAEARIFGLGEQRSTSDPEEIMKILDRMVDTHIMVSPDKTNERVINTGYFELDQMTTGFHPGELIIVAGRPSMGKSSFLLSMAMNIAMGENPVPVLVFSLEMSKEQCAGNILCGSARVSVQTLRDRRNMSKEHRQRLLDAAGELSEAMIIIDDSAAVSPAQLRSRARRFGRKFGIGAIFIDYLQLMRSDFKSDNRQQEVAEISRNLKLLAKELGVPIIAGSQISREAETTKDNRPKLSHLRESGAIEQDADLVMLLYREEYYKPDDTQKPGIAEVIIAKQRNGPTGSFELRFFKEFTRFENLTVSHEPRRES